MDEFIYKAPYEEEGKRILEVNILPETYCSFNCIYCGSLSNVGVPHN